MSFTDYTHQLMVSLVDVLGGDDPSSHPLGTGFQLPKFLATQLVTVMTQYAANVVHAVTVQNGQHIYIVGADDIDSDAVPQTAYVNDDGTANTSNTNIVDVQNINSKDGTASITVAQYVAGSGTLGQAWKRWNINPGVLYQPWTGATGDQAGGQGYIQFVYQTMADWQTCIDLATQALQFVGAGDPAGPVLDPAAVEGFYIALQKLAADLDTLAENPPDTSTIKEAWGYAVDKTGVAVQDIAKKGGEALATAGNIAGQAAGSFASGFFNQASLLTLAVAGIAVFVLLR